MRSMVSRHLALVLMMTIPTAAIRHVSRNFDMAQSDREDGSFVLFFGKGLCTAGKEQLRSWGARDVSKLVLERI